MRGNAATGYGTKSRSKPRLTNKLKLAIHHGDIDADQPALDDDDDKNKVSSTAGVDAEDSHEHHLQAVLSAASLRAAGQPRASGSGAYIPTPDAAGHVPDWEKNYQPGRWEEPEGYIRFSDTIEETQNGAVAGGCTYYMDETDDEWLKKINAELCESTSPGSPRAPPRSAKARGKEPEGPQVPITNDEFELVMGILERLTDERYPCLHADVSVFPAITEFEPTFANRLPVSFFPNYRVPDWVPQPAQLLRTLRVIYPRWRERRLEREGRRIIPQINSDETNEGDPYVCFRRRDAKPVRKTRRTDTGSVDRMQSLQGNLRQLHHLAQHVLRREQLKQVRALEERQVVNCRMQLSEVKRKFPTTPFGMRDDDDVLVDKIVKRPRPEGTNILRLPRRSQNPTAATTADATPSGPTEMPDPRAVALINRKKVDEFMQRNPQQERWWDDLTDTTYMPLPPPAPPERQLRGVRLRVGRGGRRHIDRRPVSAANTPERREICRMESLQFSMRWSRGEPGPSESNLHGDSIMLRLKNGEVVTENEFERAIVTSERWRYDRDERLEETSDQPIVVDDFADRFILSRLTRHSIEDYELLAGDQSIMQHLVPSAGRPSAAILALDAARQRQLELERNPPKPSPTLATPAPTPTTNGTPANPSPEPGATPVPGAGVSPSPMSSLLANPVSTPAATPASRLLQVQAQAQALAMQQKARLLIPPVLGANSTPQPQSQQSIAIRQSRPPVSNGKPLSSGASPIQRPASSQGVTGQQANATSVTTSSPVPAAGVIPGAGGLTVPQQQRHGSGSPHDNRGGSPLRPLSGMANGVNGTQTTNGTNGVNGTNGISAGTVFPPAFQQLNQPHRLELKHFQTQNGIFVPNSVNGMMAPPIQLTLPQQRPQWSRGNTNRPGVNGAGVQGSPQNGHASPPTQLLSVPQGF